MLHRTIPDGGRFDDAALSRFRSAMPRRHDGAALFLAIAVVLFVARLAGCLVPV